MICSFNEWSCQTIFNDTEKVCNTILHGKHEHMEYDSILLEYIQYLYYEDTCLEKSIYFCEINLGGRIMDDFNFLLFVCLYFLKLLYVFIFLSCVHFSIILLKNVRTISWNEYEVVNSQFLIVVYVACSI